MNKKTISYFLLFSIIFFIIFYYIAIPQIIGKRFIDVGWMQYNGEKDKMVPKDTLEVNEGYLYYIQYGTMKGY